MTVKSGITIQNGTVIASRDAANPLEMVTLEQLNTGLAGKAAVSHTHQVSQVTDIISQLPGIIAASAQDSGGFYFILANGPGGNSPGVISGVVRLKPSGGLGQDATGLYVNLSGVAHPGDPIVVAQIADWTNQFLASLEGDIYDSNTIFWLRNPTGMSGVVRIAPNAGILNNPTGIYLDFAPTLGGGQYQVSPGNHSHSLLHNPLTLGTTSSIQWSLLPGQVLNLDVLLAPAISGLMIGPSGLQCNFAPDTGGGEYQVARGSHTHSQLHDPVTVIPTNSIDLMIGTDQQLSGVAVLDPSPPNNNAIIVAGVNGMYVPLGSGVNQPARGIHGHAVATETADGFMSKQDKQRLDSLLPGGVLIHEVLSTQLTGIETQAGPGPLGVGILDWIVAPMSGVITGWDLVADQAGNVTIDILKCQANVFPGSLASITGGQPLTLTAQQLNQNLSVNPSIWSTQINPNDVLAFSVTMASGVYRAKAQLRWTRYA